MDNKAAAAAAAPDISPSKPEKFSVYQNPAICAALTATSLRRSSPSLLFLFSLSSASAVAALFAFSSGENNVVEKLKVLHVSEVVAYLLIKVLKIIVYLAFVGASTGFIKALASARCNNRTGAFIASGPNGTKVDTSLSSHQLRLLGLQTKTSNGIPEPRRPPVSKTRAGTAPSDPLVPLHQLSTSPSRPSFGSSEKSNSGTAKNKSFGVSTRSPHSPAPFRSPPPSSQLSFVNNSPGLDQFLSTPWSNKRVSPMKEIITEDELEHFLADVDKKITESAERLATLPHIRNGFSISSPSTISGAANTSGTTRTTPLRPVRMSPSSQKYTTPPKKGEAETPSPMSMEESIMAFKNLGIYPQIEEWRDRLRQWFSSVLLIPLLDKIENSHTKVMQTVAKLGISVTVSPVGSGSSGGGASTVSPIERTKEWQPTFTPDEDGLLNQLRASLVQSLDASIQRTSLTNQQQNQQQNAFLPIMQECLDAIIEHQRLLALMKGELIKSLLPQSSIPAEYTVSRIKELGEGTCLKNYEYMRKDVDSDKLKKKWTLELPTDSHLLLYLFCAFLEYPKWMLHVDPSSYSGAQSGKNPLFLGALPPKERFPEKYVAVISATPSTIHPGASVLVLGRQCPPAFAIYWDKKMQLCLQGRTALWDSILILSHRIRISYGGFVRGIHLGSTALCLLPVLESEEDEE